MPAKEPLPNSGKGEQATLVAAPVVPTPVSMSMSRTSKGPGRLSATDSAGVGAKDKSDSQSSAATLYAKRPNCPTAARGRISSHSHRTRRVRSINHFQGGASVDVFDPKGSNPTQNWKLSGPVQKVYDKAVKGYIFHCDGGPNAKMQLPKDDRRSLGLVQPYLVLQVCVSMTKPFALELSLTDTARARRRLLFSTSFREAVCTPLHTRVPLGEVQRGVWVNLTFDMADLTATNFGGARFGRLESITIGAACKLRKIMTLRDPTVAAGDIVSAEQPASVPRGLELPSDVESYTQMFSQGPDLRRSASASDFANDADAFNCPSPGSMPGTMTVPGSPSFLGSRGPPSRITSAAHRLPAAGSPGLSPMPGSQLRAASQHAASRGPACLSRAASRARAHTAQAEDGAQQRCIAAAAEQFQLGACASPGLCGALGGPVPPGGSPRRT